MWKTFVESPWGQAALAFGRMFTVTLVAQWVNAGLPISTFEVAAFLGWLELAAQTGAGLVIANYLGPWEERYGLQPRADRDL